MIASSDDVDEISVSFKRNGISVGGWDMWTDYDEPGEEPEDVLELWAMIRDLRIKMMSLFGPNGSRREYLVWPD